MSAKSMAATLRGWAARMLSAGGVWAYQAAGWLADLGRTGQSEADAVRDDTASVSPSPASSVVPAPQMPVAAPARVPEGIVVYAVGDVHGRADLLKSLFAIIREDARQTKASPRLVMLGDYVDRGFQSRQVIDMLIDDTLSGFETAFIKGNHEAAMLKFHEQAEYGPEWANYGGRETLVSYGVRPPRSMSFNEEWRTAHAEFQARLPAAHLHFLRSLELSARIGDYGFVHAGMKPGRAFDEQEEHDLLWIRDEFLRADDREDVFVVHGHTPVDDAYSDKRRINVDTGAYFSGRLTAVRLEGDQMSFLKTR